MNEWTQADAIRAKLHREWERGRILEYLWGGTTLFPYRLPLRGPNTHDMVDRYEAVREWIHEVSRWQAPDVVVEWRDFKHPVLGQNQVPIALTMTSAESALRWIDKQKEANQATTAFGLIEHELPELKGWALAHPLQVLKWRRDWPRLIAVVRWAKAHPHSGLYIRQADVPGIDTKFVEQHRGILRDLDRARTSTLVEHKSMGISEFETRYGFRQKPEMVRFRFLDPQQSIQGMTDITVPSREFSQLRLPVRRIFMMENEIAFLTFPHRSESLAIFGSGYGLKRFQAAHWLALIPLYYWGDLDTHGFAILDELRHYFPHAESLLMDEETLLAYQEFWDRENRPSTHTLTRLSLAESTLYESLQRHQFGEGVRLEQERIPLHWLVQRLTLMGIPGEKEVGA